MPFQVRRRPTGSRQHRRQRCPGLPRRLRDRPLRDAHAGQVSGPGRRVGVVRPTPPSPVHPSSRPRSGLPPPTGSTPLNPVLSAPLCTGPPTFFSAHLFSHQTSNPVDSGRNRSVYGRSANLSSPSLPPQYGGGTSPEPVFGSGALGEAAPTPHLVAT